MSFDQVLAVVDVPATGGNEAFKDFTVPAIYLSPGELSLLVYAEAPGFVLNTFALQPAAQSPAVYPAALTHRSGVAELTGRGEAGHPFGYVRNLGRSGSSLTFGVQGGVGGPRTLRLHYSSGQTKPVALALTVGDKAAVKLAMPPTGGEWKSFDVPVVLEAGANRVLFTGQEENWESVSLDQLEVTPR